MGEQRVMHCACGAIREVPSALRFVSCVKCGRAMAQRRLTDSEPSPTRWIVSAATLASQLLGTVAFAIALVWIVKHGNRAPWVVGVLALGAVCVFAGGIAHRGSLRALAICVLLDSVVAVVCLGHVSSAKGFVLPPVAWVAPSVAHQLATAMTITGVVAALAAIACVAAAPQARRFAQWSAQAR